MRNAERNDGVESATDRSRWVVLALVCFATYAVLVDTTIVNVALPHFVTDLGASTTQLKWIVDAYNLAFASLVLVGGTVGDRFGRREALLAGLVIFAAGNVAAALMTSAGGVIAARSVMGVGAAFVFPTTLSIISNTFTDRIERSKAIGAWGAMTGLGVASGPILGGWVLTHFYWGSVFVLMVPAVAVAFVLTALRVPTSRDPEAPRLDLVGLGVSIVALGSLVTAIIQGPDWGWASASTLGLFAVSLASFVVFVWWERRVAQPMLDVMLFANLRFSAASGAVTVAFFGLFGFIFLITQYFQFVRGYTALQSGVRTLPVATSIAIAAVTGVGLAVRIGNKQVVAVGLLLMSIGFAWVSQASPGTPYVEIVGQMICLGLGLGFTSAPATEAIMGVVPKEKAGQGSAVNDATREVGGTLGVATIGSVFASLYGEKLADSAAWKQIPAGAYERARDGIGLALRVAGSAAQQVGPAAADSLVRDAKTAFMSGLQGGCLVASGATLVGAVFVLVFLPAHVARADDSSHVTADRVLTA
jgi:EmrB/QacA subfamily drug resistance transporter